ncbi:RWP-RK domain-containing protein [Haematococcus lacustris]|uniref:RWP-RK domain-containing protein n=1 Tax=Haematococcus lacustris TaxID=44745 RepID=A0A699YUT9_HAELA|nr:RWP-RK domain-containing protein [Haematococcus lacustris]
MTGVSAAALEAGAVVCYDINIERWPFRKLTGLQQLQKNLESHPFQQKEKQQQKLQAVAHEYERVMQNPNRVVDSKLLALRTRTYKRRASARNKGGQATTASASPGADSDRDSARERAAASSEGEPELGVRASVSTAASGLQPKGRGKSGGVTSSAAVPRVAALREVSPGQDSQVLGSVGSLGSAGSRTLAAREVERQHSSALLAGSSGGAASRPGLATAAAAAPHQVTTGAVPTGADPALASWMARLADDGDDMMMSDALLGSGFDMHMSSLSDVHAAIASLEPEPSAALLPSQPPPPVQVAGMGVLRVALLLQQQAYQLVSLEDLQAMSGSLLPHPTHDNQVQASYWATSCCLNRPPG